MKAQLLAKLESINADIAGRIKELAIAKEACATIEVQIGELKKEIKSLEDQF